MRSDGRPWPEDAAETQALAQALHDFARRHGPGGPVVARKTPVWGMQVAQAMNVLGNLASQEEPWVLVRTEEHARARTDSMVLGVLVDHIEFFANEEHIYGKDGQQMALALLEEASK